jgi:SAM-dependent methyltransferase
MREIDNSTYSRSTQMLLDKLQECGLPADLSLYRAPNVRAKVDTLLLDKALSEKNFDVLVDNPSGNQVRGAVQHNLDALLSTKGFSDRGAKLVELTLADLEPRELEGMKVLHIGSRNLSEILCGVGFGLQLKNISAIDLISYHPIVSIGDVHQIPFGDSEFDLIIVGWILAYSSDVDTAIREIFRVLAPGGKVAIGWDLNAVNYWGDSGLLDGNDAPWIKDCDSILTLINNAGIGSVEVLHRREPCYPYSDWGRQCILVVRQDSKFVSQHIRQLRFESRAISSVRQALSEHPDISILERLDGHIRFLKTREFSEQAYFQMRQHYLRYGRSLDNLIQQQIALAFPPIISNKPLLSSKFFGQHSRESLVAISAELKERGYYKFPFRLEKALIEQLRGSIKYQQTTTARAFASESDLLKNNTIIQLWLDEVLISIAELYFGSVPILDFVAATKTDASSLASLQEMDSDAQMWHFDKDRISFLKVFVYLTDVLDTSGPHQFISGSHHSPPARDGRFLDDDLEHSSALIETFFGGEGTVFIEDTHGLHRGTPVKEGSRHMLQLEYANSLFGQKSSEVYDCVKYFLPRYQDLINYVPRLFLRFFPR